MYNDNTEKPTLTVAQLIEKLENLDPDLDVTYRTWDSDYYGYEVCGISDVYSDGDRVSLGHHIIEWIDDSDIHIDLLIESEE